MTSPSTIRLFGTAPDSIVDGPGLRFAVFVQGCTHRCPGCHNPESQPACAGEVRHIDDLMDEIAANKLTQGVTISGGEPFEQAAACAEVARRAHALGLNVWTYSGYRYEDLCAAAAGARMGGAAAASTSAGVTAGEGVSMGTTATAGAGARCAAAASTGVGVIAGAPSNARRTFACLDGEGVLALLDETDVLVDGPFVQALHSYELTWRGSSNQRLIDIAATRRAGRIVLWETRQEIPEKPPSW